jgi:peptide/nickel transport system ATP-binding protein
VSTRIILEREIADPANPPPGCPFHPRCRYAQDRCRTEVPAMEEVRPGRFVACLRALELDLRGINTEIAA